MAGGWDEMPVEAGRSPLGTTGRLTDPVAIAETAWIAKITVG
jgi:hypothetical protein